MPEEQLKQADCSPACGFRVRSHEEEEVRQIIKKHAKDKHNLNWSDDDVKIKPA